MKTIALIFVILAILVMPVVGEGVRAWIDQDCVQNNARIVVPTGNTASGFSFSNLESGVNCHTFQSIPEKSWSITSLSGGQIYTCSLGENGKLIETPGKLSTITLSAGTYEVSVSGGYGAQVLVEYQINTPGGGGPGTIIEHKGTGATIESVGGESYPKPQKFTVPPGCTATDFSVGGPDNGMSNDNTRSWSLYDANTDQELYSYFEVIGEEPVELLGPLSRLVLGPGTYKVGVSGSTGASVSVGYDLTCPDPKVVNRTPIIRSLTASPVSPGSTGGPIIWTAKASDADGDQIFYRFYLNGPGSKEKSLVRDWSADRTWTWHPEEGGEYQIEVQIRDDHHSGPVSSDGQMTEVYQIDDTEPEVKALFDLTPSSGIVPLTVQFTDRSTGGVTRWSWDFGDGGRSTDQNPSHTYTQAAICEVTETVQKGSESSTASKTVITTDSSEKVIARFDPSTTSGEAPLTISFADGSSGNPTGYLWDFGDGETSTGKSPEHTYAKEGNYQVSLTVTGDTGSSDAISKKIIVSGGAGTLKSDFSYAPKEGDDPLVIVFTDRSTGDAESYLWDFGDGGNSYERNPEQTYTRAGTYIITLTVTNSAGSDAISKQITIPSEEKPTKTPTTIPSYTPAQVQSVVNPSSEGEIFKGELQASLNGFDAVNTLVFAISPSGEVSGSMSGYATSSSPDGRTDVLTGDDPCTGTYDPKTGELKLQGRSSNTWSSGQTIDFDQTYEATRSGDSFVGVLSGYDSHSTVCPVSTQEVTVQKVTSPDDQVNPVSYTYEDKNCRWVKVSGNSPSPTPVS